MIMFWRDDAEVIQFVNKGGDGYAIGFMKADELGEGDDLATGAAHLFVDCGLGQEEVADELAAEAFHAIPHHLACFP